MAQIYKVSSIGKIAAEIMAEFGGGTIEGVEIF